MTEGEFKKRFREQDEQQDKWEPLGYRLNLEDIVKVVEEAKADFPKIDEYGNFFEADGDKQAITWFKKWFGQP